MLAILLTPLPLLLAFRPLPSLDFTPKSVLSFPSHLVVIQKSFPLPTSVMLSILLLLENAVQVTKSLQDITNQSLSPTTVRRHLRKADMKAVAKLSTPFFLPSIARPI
jgi:hypothetical protein